MAKDDLLKINEVVIMFHNELFKDKDTSFEYIDTYSSTIAKSIDGHGISTTFKKGKIVFDDKSYGIDSVEHYWLEHRNKE